MTVSPEALLERIEDLDELVVLGVLLEAPKNAVVTLDTITSRARMPADAVQEVLTRLERCGLLLADRSAAVGRRSVVPIPEIEAALRSLVEQYRTDPTRIMTAMSANAMARARSAASRLISFRTRTKPPE